MPTSPSPSPAPRARPEASSSAPSTPKPRTTARQPRQQWTDEEEDIWREIVTDVLRKHLLAAVRADGRLNNRNGSLKSHLNAYVRRL